MYVCDSISIFLVGFLIGSVPFGVLLARLFRLPDPRGIGSGNIGATNMLRTGRKDIAALTLLLDALKGVLPVLFVTRLLHGAPVDAAFALLCALIGHCYTPWLRGKGGKGVATALGGAFAIGLTLGIIFCLAWLAVFLVTRYVSLASLTALASMPLIALGVGDERAALVLAFAVAIGTWRHCENIQRLRTGTEPKMVKRHA